MQTTHVLVVDDDVEIRKLLHLVLEEEGYAVSEAADGERALAMMRSKQPPSAVVVLDRIMPHMDGLAVLRALAATPEITQRYVFVFLTARQEFLPPADEAILQRFAIPLVYKPFELDALLAAVRDAAARLAPNSAPLP